MKGSPVAIGVEVIKKQKCGDVGRVKKGWRVKFRGSRM